MNVHNVLTALKCQLFHKFFCPCQRLRLADINQFQLLRKITRIIRLPASSQIKIHDGKLAFPARCLHQPEDSRRKDMNTAKGILPIERLIIVETFGFYLPRILVYPPAEFSKKRRAFLIPPPVSSSRSRSSEICMVSPKSLLVFRKSIICSPK